MLQPLTTHHATDTELPATPQGTDDAVCPITVKKSLVQVPGVSGAKVDFDKKTVTVTFDADKATTAVLVKATTDAGFPSTPRK